MLKEYSRLANFNFAKAQLCNPEICRLYLATLEQSTNNILQKVLLYVVKASYAIKISCNKFNQKEGEFKEIPTPVIDSLALLETSTIEMNQLRQDLIRHKLPANLKHLAKDVPLGLNFCLGMK